MTTRLPWWALEPQDILTARHVPDTEPAPDAPLMERMMWDREQFVLDMFENITVDSSLTEIRTALLVLGSAARIQWIIHHANDLDADKLAALLPETWAAPNMNLGGPRGFTSEVARFIYNKTGYVCDQGQTLDPENLVTVYHGWPEHWETWTWNGWCWTTDVDIATRFAGPNANAFVLKTTIPERLAKARYDDRGESEWVFDPMDVLPHFPSIHQMGQPA